MINLSGLSYTYSTGGDALKSLTLDVGRGQLVGLVGANGSGKSTFMALVAGLYTPTRGSLRVGDRVSPGGERDIRRMVRLVMQDADIQILGGTVKEDLLMGRKRTNETVERARRMAASFHLLDSWERPVQSLSWGMKRKLCLAAALLDEPGVLLLDEPFSGLDYPGVCEMRRIIRENHRAGLTQIVSSHDLESFIDIVDELAVLNAGALVMAGPPETVLPHVEEHDVRPPCAWRAGLGVGSWEGEGE